MKRRILLIDDDEDLAEMMTRFLESRDFETAHGANGKEGFEQVLIFKPDLILLDLDMPVMDGFTFLKLFRSNPEYNLIPVIVLSGDNQNKVTIEALKLGAENFIPKPFALPVALWHIKNTFRITSQYASVNALTGFPENPQIYAEINHLLQGDRDFTLLSLEIKDFRQFNRYYEFKKGRDVLDFTAGLLRKYFNGDFLGHPEDSVFVVITKKDEWREPLERIIKVFENRRGDFYDPVVAAKKHIDIVDRVGNIKEVDLISLSVGVVPIAGKDYQSAEEVMEAALEVRFKAKSGEGSHFYVDKRKSLWGQQGDLPRLKVAVFDGNRHMVRTLLHFLAPMEVTPVKCDSIDDLVDRQTRDPVDAIFLDVELGDILEALRDIRYYERKRNLPHSFITVLTQKVSQAEVIHLIKNGASNIMTSPISKDLAFHNYKKIMQSLRK